MRLIDADALFPYGAVPYEKDGFATADKLYGIIKSAPTVDAVPVVRCGSCANRPKNTEYGMCRIWWKITHKDEFCYRAAAGSDGADG